MSHGTWAQRLEFSIVTLPFNLPFCNFAICRFISIPHIDQIELALLRNEHVLGSSAPPVDLGRRRQAAKAAPLRVRARGRSPGGQTEGSRPLNLSVREEEPLFQFVKKAPQPQAMPKEANEALLNLIAKTGRDLEITRKTRKAGELDSSQRLRRENLESSLNFSPIAPQVNFDHILVTFLVIFSFKITRGNVSRWQ